MSNPLNSLMSFDLRYVSVLLTMLRRSAISLSGRSHTQAASTIVLPSADKELSAAMIEASVNMMLSPRTS